MSTGAPPAQKPHGAESISTGTIPVRLPVQENSTGNSTRMPERSRGVLPLTGESARGLRRQKSSQRLDVRDILKPANHLDGGLSFVCRPLCEFCAIFELGGDFIQAHRICGAAFSEVRHSSDRTAILEMDR